jgi:hypothetical protein
MVPCLFAQKTGEGTVAHTPDTVGGRLALLVVRSALMRASTMVALRGIPCYCTSRHHVAQLVALSTLSKYRRIAGSNKLDVDSKHPDPFGPC